MSGNKESNGKFDTLEKVEEINAIYVEISENVNRYWKSGVTSKLKLAQEIKKFFDSVEKTGAESNETSGEIGDAINKAETNFYKLLPFGQKVAEKFNRIANAEWLNDKGLKISILPNCYNTLEKLASTEVCGNPEVVDYLKENLTSSSTREDVGALIRKATATEPDGDDKDEGEESVEARKTLLLSIKINKDAFGKSFDDVSNLILSVKGIEDFIKDKSNESFGDADGAISDLGSDVFNIEVKDNVFDALVKTAKKSEADAFDWKSVLPRAA